MPFTAFGVAIFFLPQPGTCRFHGERHQKTVEKYKQVCYPILWYQSVIKALGECAPHVEARRTESLLEKSV